MNKGFTLIEVLVSLVILSMIAVISSNILQSSLELERTSSQRLSSVRSLNFSSILIRRDIRQIINVPLKDFYGNPMSATLIGNNEDKRIMFNTKIKSISNNSSPIKRVEYVLEDNKFIRRQFFSTNPYDADEFIATFLIEDISQMDIEFMFQRQWYQQWPISPITERQIPTLIKFKFKKNQEAYEWIVEPNIEYVFQN
ncbi:MAG: type II secretion system protein GspJ [Pseudomonadota bacterium]|jgi:type II secretion system protein J|nr:type II secretion system protein GspJ [Pseudomonadota bacterium]|tara:strand:+ start:464 stop:1057 length:594 start_codon:yes stop_codon:yes gene_type:complete